MSIFRKLTTEEQTIAQKLDAAISNLFNRHNLPVPSKEERTRLINFLILDHADLLAAAPVNTSCNADKKNLRLNMQKDEKKSSLILTIDKNNKISLVNIRTQTRPSLEKGSEGTIIPIHFWLERAYIPAPKTFVLSEEKQIEELDWANARPVEPTLTISTRTSRKNILSGTFGTTSPQQEYDLTIIAQRNFRTHTSR